MDMQLVCTKCKKGFKRAGKISVDLAPLAKCDK